MNFSLQHILYALTSLLPKSAPVMDVKAMSNEQLSEHAYWENVEGRFDNKFSNEIKERLKVK